LCAQAFTRRIARQWVPFPLSSQNQPCALCKTTFQQIWRFHRRELRARAFVSGRTQSPVLFVGRAARHQSDLNLECASNLISQRLALYMFCVCFVRAYAPSGFSSRSLYHRSAQRITINSHPPWSRAATRMLQPNHFLARTTLCSHIWRHQIISARGRNKILSPHHLEKKRSAHGYSSPCVGGSFACAVRRNVLEIDGAWDTKKEEERRCQLVAPIWAVASDICFLEIFERTPPLSKDDANVI
jgi:hypothetical protein